MIVVAGASPINYLIQAIDILTEMYGRVVIPQSVREEFVRPSAPESVRSWVDFIGGALLGRWDRKRDAACL